MKSEKPREKGKKPGANPLVALHDEGQAVWLDFLSRRFLAEGGLKRLIEHDGLTGVTSNPSIFEKAIAESKDYDASLQSLEAGGDLDVMALYERLAIDDIRHAADDLRPVYDRSGGADGFVSIEVSPYLAMDTQATIAEARRLSKAVDRPNLMVKVPATKAGLPAIRRLTGAGINVNITLLFSQQVYEDVVEAYLGGLEDYVAQGGDPHRVSSVASFFVSRIDVAVDKIVEEKLHATRDAEKRKLMATLRGEVAIANAKLAYQRYKRLFSGTRWERLKAKGARVQRVLWASTSTKTPGLSDVLYVERLIGRDTINTAPPATLDAFRDHGHVHPTLEEKIAEAERTMAALSQSGISIDAVTSKLTEDGVQQFADAFDKLLGALAGKRAQLLGAKLNSQQIKLPDDLNKAVDATLKDWQRSGNVRRLWAGDARLWTGSDEDHWIGWLDIVASQRKRLGSLKEIADDVHGEGFMHAVLLGMGGSSLGPEVLGKTFGHQRGYPELIVLDSTDPEQICAVEAAIDLAKTLFIVSSKSGSTLEPNVLKDYFFERAKKALGADRAGSHFIAITDPGSGLERVAKTDRFRHLAFGVPSIGGRYSVLSDFGMIPAAIVGLDIDRLLEAAQRMVNSCGAAVPPRQNPGVVLGAVLAEAARSGRNKVTIVASPAISYFGAWLEQLLAESTGKQGKGMIPVDAEPVASPENYGNDRLFAYIRLAGEADRAQDSAMTAIERAGNPVIHIDVSDRYNISQEFFRWEMATAVAGAVIAINPFDQPDVEASKDKARALTDAYEKGDAIPAEKPVLKENGIAIYADGDSANIIKRAPGGATLEGSLKAYLGQLRSGDYCALLAYIARDKAHENALRDIRVVIRDAKRVATCVGFGPRFLHSTGQAYKGGPNTGVFLELTCDARHDLPVPGHKYSFGTVIAAQARGDFSVLNERKRRAIRVHLGADVSSGLEHLKAALRRALV
ncbi:MAG TPA: bifunctional transaldolase/phosoglucose isomerase [Pseudolabrys sp.]|nr:bifunctional transaldolase/phosoglucose isomerase [Pseudolabrys sp.]